MRIAGFIIILLLMFGPAFADLKVSPQNLRQGSSTTVSVLCEDCSTGLSGEFDLIFDNDDDIFIDWGPERISCENGIEVLASIYVEPGAQTGKRQAKLMAGETDDVGETDWRFLDKGHFIIIPESHYQLLQGGGSVNDRILPGLEVDLVYPEVKDSTRGNSGQNIIISVLVTSEVGETIEPRRISSYYHKGSNNYYYNLGAYEPGDILKISIYENRENNTDAILAPYRKISVRPGRISYRSGFCFVVGHDPYFENKIIPVISITPRLFRSPQNDMLNFGLPSIGIALDTDRLTFALGANLEFYDAIGITIGTMLKDRNEKSIGFAGFAGISLDIRILKKILDTVAGGLSM